MESITTNMIKNAIMSTAMDTDVPVDAEDIMRAWE